VKELGLTWNGDALKDGSSLTVQRLVDHLKVSGHVLLSDSLDHLDAHDPIEGAVPTLAERIVQDVASARYLEMKREKAERTSGMAR
jgi:hypothetical protein